MSDAIYGRTFLSGRMSIAVSRLARIWKVFPGGINISMWHHLQLPQHAAAFINNLNFGGVSLANKTLEYFAWCRVGLRILQLAGSSQRQQKSYACAKWPKLWPPDGKPASRPTDRQTRQKSANKTKCNCVENAVLACGFVSPRLTHQGRRLGCLNAAGCIPPPPEMRH